MFETAVPCIVELFGHNKIAGNVSDQAVGGASFVRVDVPEVEGQKSFTKLYGANAIYAITPTDEATMLQAVRAFRAVPIERWALESTVHAKLSSGNGYEDDDQDDDRDIGF